MPIEPGKIYTGSLVVHYSGEDYPSGYDGGGGLKAFFEVSNACGYVLEVSGGPSVSALSPGDLKEGNTVDEAYSSGGAWTLAFQIRVRKKAGDDSANQSAAAGTTSPRSIPRAFQDVMGSGSQPSEIIPPSFSASVSLGATPSSGGFDTGSISLSGGIGPSLANVANLSLRDPGGNSLGVVRDGGNLRQVSNLTRLIDIQPVSGGGFEISSYEAGSFVIPPNSPSGPYPINSEAVAYLKARYVPLAAGSGHLGGIRITTTGPDGVAHVRDVVFTASNGESWRVIEQGGAEVHDYQSIFTKEGTRWARTDLSTETRDGSLFSKSQRVYLYQTRRGGSPSSVVESELFLVQELTYDTASHSLLTVWEPDPDFLGRAKSVTRPDGSWELYRYYPVGGTNPSWAGRLKETLRPWPGDSTIPVTPSAANCESTLLTYNTLRAIEGLQVCRRTTTVPVGGSPKVVKDWSRTPGTFNFTALNSILASSDFNSAWLPSAGNVSQENSSDYASSAETLTSHSFTYISSADPGCPWIGNSFASLDDEGNGTVTGYERGTNNSGTFTANDLNGSQSAWGSDVRSTTVKVVDGVLPPNFEATKEVTIQDRRGKAYRRELWIKDGNGWNLATTTTYEYPTLWQDGTPKVVIEKQDGRIVSKRTDISATETETEDEQGIVTRTVRDESGRTLKVTKIGIAAASGRDAQPNVVTSYTYNGHSTTVTTSSGGLSRTQTSVEDLAGRTVSETDATGAVTATSYPNNGRETLETLPGGLTRLTTRNRLGQTVSVTGTAVIDQHTDYSVLPSGNRVTTSRTGDLANSPRYTVSEQDWAGRSVKTSLPNPTGTGEVTSTTNYVTGTSRVEFQTTPTGTMLLTHPTVGSALNRSGFDLNSTAGLQVDSTDRISESIQSFTLEGGYWWQVSTRKTYDKDDNGGSAITSISKTCLHGAPDGFASKTISIAPGGATTTVTTAIDRANKTVTQTEISSASSINAVVVSVNGLTVSSSGHDTTNPTRVSYSALGQPVKQTSPRGEITLKSYNPSGQLATTTDHLNQVTSYSHYPPTHASAGRMSVVTNPQGKTTTYSYSPLGEVSEQAGTATYRVTYGYDDFGARNKMWTWRDATTSSLTEWVYQPGTGLLLTKLDAASQPTSYTYYASGKIHTRIWARGVITTYSYSPLGDLIGIDYSDSTPDVSLDPLDRLGRPTSIAQTGIGKETLSYHPGVGAPKAQFYTSGHTLLPGIGIRHTAPDTSGRTSGFEETTDSDVTVLRSVAYGYDSAGRIETITDGSETSVYSYHPNSSLIASVESKTSGTSWFKESRYYDTPGRLIGIRSDRMSGNTLVAPISAYGYDYDSLGRRTKATFQDGSHWQYGYNDRSEVTSATRKTPAAAVIPQLGATYDYDGIGNRLSSTSPVLGDHTYTPNSLNQYASLTTGNTRTAIGRAPTDWNVLVDEVSASRTGQLYHRALTASNSEAPVWQIVVTRRDSGTPTSTKSFWYAQASFAPTYDLDGNLTNDGRWLYVWNAENRLIQMESTPAATTPDHPYTKLVFVYDWMGRRIARHVWQGGSQSSHRWLYEGWNVITELTAPSDSSTTLTRASLYTWGIDLSGRLQGAGGVGGLISQTTIASGVKERASYDGNGNVIAWTKSDQSAPTSRREYDAFGNTLVSEGATPCNFGFSTKIQDLETGLYYYGYRFYDAEHGRWLNRDPVGERGGANLVRFVSNDSNSSFDVNGLTEVSAWIKFRQRTRTENFVSKSIIYTSSWNYGVKISAPVSSEKSESGVTLQTLGGASRSSLPDAQGVKISEQIIQNSELDVMYWKKPNAAAVPPFRRTDGDGSCVQCAVWKLYLEAEVVFDEDIANRIDKVTDWIIGRLPIEEGFSLTYDIASLLIGITPEEKNDKHASITQIIICADGKISIFSGGFSMPKNTTVNITNTLTKKLEPALDVTDGIYSQSSLDPAFSPARNYFRKN